MNKFKTVQEAGLASQVLTEVLNTHISFHYSQGYPGEAISVSPDGDFWQVECGFDYVVALFIWRQENGQYGGRAPRPWAGEALLAWEKWQSGASPSEFAAVQNKVAKIFNDFREDVSNARAAGYRWSNVTDTWTEADDDPY